MEGTAELSILFIEKKWLISYDAFLDSLSSKVKDFVSFPSLFSKMSEEYYERFKQLSEGEHDMRQKMHQKIS